MILLLTNKDDITIDFVVRELQNRGCSYYRLNTEDIPEIVRVSFSINEDSYIIYDTVKRQYINLNDVSAVYFRRPKISDLSHISEISPQEKRYLQSELASLLEGIYKTLRHAFWINDIYRIREAENKIYQLQLAKQIGFEIPQSMISNSVSPLQEILQKSNGNCIIKPIRSGNMGYPDGRQVIFTSQFNESVLDWEDRINAFPSYLQENLNKAYDIRCTVIGDNVFAAAISSQNNPDSCIDFLLCKVEDISSGNRRRIIKSIFEYIYGSDGADYAKFEQADKDNKIILIDDIHLIKSQHINGFLEGIEDEFGYVIYTTNNLLKLDIQERIKMAIAKDSYSCYRILPLYRAKRKELVEKIIPLKYSNHSEKERGDQVERICHALDLQRRYIPLSPEIILQFIEHYANYQMESAQNDGNIFGKVFESTITSTLSPHMSGTLTVDKAMLVLGKIGFYIHTKRKYPISDKDIIAVIDDYCEEYGAKIDAVNFIATVTKAGILTKYEERGAYKFCNNNYLAYFIASEICANKDREAVQYCLEYSCFGINSTVLMFITYLANETSLIDTILTAATSVSEEWKEFSFGMPELKHLEVRSPIKRLTPPSKYEADRERQIDDEKDRAEIDNSQVDVVSIYDYKEEEIEKLENQLIRSISLLMLIARCLPNFEHRLKKAQKQAVIRAIYELPNKIFYAWAIETERQKDALIQMILQMETNEFTRKICTEDDAKRYLQRNSVSLLLELYYGTISNAYRENTYEYLTGMAAETVKFDSETYALEKLIVLLQSKRFASFYNEGKKVLKDTTSPAAELALYYIVQRLLMKETLSHSQAKRIESTFFMDKGHAAHLYRRQIENKDK